MYSCDNDDNSGGPLTTTLRMFTCPSNPTGGQHFDVDNQLVSLTVIAWLTCVHIHLNDVVVLLAVDKGLRVAQYACKDNDMEYIVMAPRIETDSNFKVTLEQVCRNE